MTIDQELEKKILSQLVKSYEKVLGIQQRNVTSAFFQLDSGRKLYEILVWYTQNYTKVPSSDDFQEIIKMSTKMSDDLKKKVVVFFEEVYTFSDNTNFDLLLDELFHYHKSNLLIQSLDVAVSHFENKKVDNAIDSLKSNLVKIDRIFTDATDYSGFLGEHSTRLLAEHMDKRANPNKYKGVLIGYEEFDQATGGLRPGTVTLIIGEMKSAKSVLAMNIGHNVSSPDPSTGNPGKRVYYHLNEGGFNLAIERLISCGTSVNYNHIRNGSTSQEEVDKIKEFLEGDRDKFFIDPVAPMSSSSAFIDNKLLDLERVFGDFGLVIVDYIGQMKSVDKTLQSTWEKIGAITMELKHIAIKHKVPMIVISHVNRTGMKSKKDSSSFDPSDMGLSIEPLKHVDNVVSWRIEDPEAFRQLNRGKGILAIRMSRDGQCKNVPLFVDTNFMKIKTSLVSVKP